MRVLLLLALVVHLGAVETTLTLRDGRVLHGSYDERTGAMTIVVGDTGHAACHVEPGDIVTRKDVVVPEEAVETPIELARHLQEAEDAAAGERQRIANERRLYDAEVQRKKDESEARARQRAFDRAAYWHAQGMTFPMVGLSIEEMDTKAAAYNKAAFWKARGQNFNPESVPAEEMDRIGREVETQAAILKQRQDEEERDEHERQSQLLIDQAAEKKEQGELAAQRKQQDEDERQAIIQRRQQVEADREAELKKEAEAAFIRYEVESVAAVALLGTIALWIAPAYIAKKRRHRNYLAITILCLLLPFLGCVALLMYSEIPVAAAIQRVIIGSIELVAWGIALIWSLYRSEADVIASRTTVGERVSAISRSLYRSKDDVESARARVKEMRIKKNPRRAMSRTSLAIGLGAIIITSCAIILYCFRDKTDSMTRGSPQVYADSEKDSDISLDRMDYENSKPFKPAGLEKQLSEPFKPVDWSKLKTPRPSTAEEIYEGKYIDIRFHLFEGIKYHWLKIMVRNRGLFTITRYHIKVNFSESGDPAHDHIVKIVDAVAGSCTSLKADGYCETGVICDEGVSYNADKELGYIFDQELVSLEFDSVPTTTPETVQPTPVTEDPKPAPSQIIRDFMLSINPTGWVTTYSDDTRAKIFQFTRKWIATADLELIPQEKISVHPIDAEHPDDFNQKMQDRVTIMRLDQQLLDLQKARVILMNDNASVSNSENAWGRVLMCFRDVFFMNNYFNLKGLE